MKLRGHEASRFIFIVRTCQGGALAAVLGPVHSSAAAICPLTGTWASPMSLEQRRGRQSSGHEYMQAPALLRQENRVTQARGSGKTGKREVLINVLALAQSLASLNNKSLLYLVPRRTKNKK